MTMLRAIPAIVYALAATGAAAQAVDESALEALEKTSPVVQPVMAEPAGAAELRAAMRRISLSPSDADALADAGNAALMLGDANAALNFFTRANSLRPNNGRIVAGLATATVRTENPFEALRLFDDAVRLGVSERSIAADRALAFDLLGNFGRAQQDYKLARTASVSDDLIVRHAISTSLSGQSAEADAMLVPLLEKSNPAAWRARAFILASRGDFRESAKVTQGFMDAGSAQRMERFLRLMPELTGAQQAAAIHLGHFPASQYVGRDSEQVRKVASTIPAVQPAANDSRLIPAGDPLGKKPAKVAAAEKPKTNERRRDKKAREQEEVKAIVAAIPDSQKLPKVDTARLGTETARARVEEASSAKLVTARTTELPPPETARPLQRVEIGPRDNVPQSQTPPPPVRVAAQTVTQPVQQAPAISANSGVKTQTVAAGFEAATRVEPATSAPAPAPALATANVPQEETKMAAALPVETVPVPTPTPTPPPAAKAAFDLGAIVNAIEIPESEQKPSAVPVDLKKIKPAAPKVAAVDEAGKAAKTDPKAAAKAKAPPPSPARFWVQIATGDANALGFDYRKWAKKSPDLFKSTSGWTSAWGKTSRLLVGPFADQKLAKKWEADFKKAGGDGFMWKSENGVVVTALKGK